MVDPILPLLGVILLDCSKICCASKTIFPMFFMILTLVAPPTFRPQRFHTRSLVNECKLRETRIVPFKSNRRQRCRLFNIT